MFSNGQRNRNTEYSKIKVCLIVTSQYERSPHCIRIATSLAKYFTVEIVEVDSQRKTNSVEIKDEIKVTTLGFKWWPKNLILKFIVSFWRVLQVLLRAKADVYTCCGLSSLIFAVPIKVLTKKKVIYDCYEHYPYQFTAPALQKTISQYIIWNFILGIENALAQLSDYILVVPSYDNILLERFKRLKKDSVSEIWNLPSLKLLDKGEKNNRPKNYKTILYVGAIGDNTGVFKLLESIPKVTIEFPNTKVLLIGSVNNLKELLIYINHLGIEKNVEILKPIPYIEISKIYRSADIGIVLYQPTFWTLRTKASEKLFEYMLFSLPMVVSNFPGLREIVKTCNSGVLVDPTNVEEISRVLIRLLRNPHLADMLGKNGRNAVLTRYNWEYEEKKLIYVYSHLRAPACNVIDRSI
jgi:glycosyltransferase involved in cell wall biosynthesis